MVGLLKTRDLHTLLYSSRAKVNLDDPDFVDILVRARETNHRRDITGILIHHRHTFFQVLEGSRQELRDLFERKLLNDPRHSHITLIHHEPLRERQFSDWSMAFEDLADNDIAEICGPAFTNGVGEPLRRVADDVPRALDIVHRIHQQILRTHH